MATNQEYNIAFEQYFSSRVARAKVITPGDKKELIAQLRRELKEQGRVPLPIG